jgi:hypothetical protein
MLEQNGYLGSVAADNGSFNNCVSGLLPVEPRQAWRRVADWEYSSLRAFVDQGTYPLDGACEPNETADTGE